MTWAEFCEPATAWGSGALTVFVVMMMAVAWSSWFMFAEEGPMSGAVQFGVLVLSNVLAVALVVATWLDRVRERRARD